MLSAKFARARQHRRVPRSWSLSTRAHPRSRSIDFSLQPLDAGVTLVSHRNQTRALVTLMVPNKAEGGSLDTPVVLLIFNRPDFAEVVFRAIAQARPKRLFVFADGPRTAEEAALCAQTR